MGNVEYPGVYVEETSARAHSIDGVPTSVTAFVGSAPGGSLDQPVPIHSLVEFERAFGAASVSVPLGAAIRLFFANGGRDAIVVRASGAAAPPQADGTGIHALGRDQAFNLLCLPDLGAEATSGDVVATATALSAASVLCEGRRAILIIDPPLMWRTAADLISGPTGLDSLTSGVRRANAALYFPRLVAGDREPLTETLPPSGAIAGIIARTDVARGVWRAAAGQAASIAGIGGLAARLSDDEARSLYEIGVNTLRSFPVVGNVVWGARTLDGAEVSPSDWRYLPVRRMALFIEESLSRGLAWAVFEPNEESLWAAIRTAVGNFLLSLFRQGAFQGTTPRDSFFVKCDRDTISQADVDAGVVNVVVGFAPLKPAEFVIIRIRLTAATA